jgi:hypothetical protein
MSKRPAAYQVLIQLAEIEPPVWRRVIFSSAMTLHELHRAMQILFSWYDYHLYEFEFAGRRFAFPDPEAEAEDSTQVRLADLKLRSGAELRYTYDFGDEWLHILEVERIRVRHDRGWLPWLLEGERRGPPEDCGGAMAYMELLESMRTPLEDLNEEERYKAEWAGLGFDPDEFCLEQARHALLLSSRWAADAD